MVLRIFIQSKLAQVRGTLNLQNRNRKFNVSYLRTNPVTLGQGSSLQTDTTYPDRDSWNQQHVFGIVHTVKGNGSPFHTQFQRLSCQKNAKFLECLTVKFANPMHKLGNLFDIFHVTESLLAILMLWRLSKAASQAERMVAPWTCLPISSAQVDSGIIEPGLPHFLLVPHDLESTISSARGRMMEDRKGKKVKK